MSQPAHPRDESPAIPPGVSLLDSVLFLLSPEQQAHYLSSAGNNGVVYANRAPTFDQPLALQLSKAAFRNLLTLLGKPPVEIEPGKWDCDYDDAQSLDYLKSELEEGVRFAPPPLDWFSDHPEGDEVPIRLETQRFGIPCRLRKHQYGAAGCLFATFLGAPDTRRANAEVEAEPTTAHEQVVDEPVDVEHLAANPGEAEATVPTQTSREFVAHVKTTWQVVGPYSRSATDIDAIALERLVFQVAANRRYSALARSTRERCEMLDGLVRLKQFAGQYRYELQNHSGDTFEFRVHAPLEAMTAMKRAYIYRDASDGLRRDRVAGLVLERVGRRNQYHLFRIPEGFHCDPPPASGYLVDTGDISQLQKQLDALRDVRHPSGRPQLMQLGALISGANTSPSEPVAWETIPIRLIDSQLTERQAEAVRKALATPDVCLIQGPPGTGKTRVISEIVRQAVRSNLKVLLVAPTHVAVDNVLERIGIKEEVSPVRCARQEKVEKLDPHIQEFTYERRANLLAIDSIRQSEADLTAWQQRVEQFMSASEILKNCASCQAAAQVIDRDTASLRVTVAKLPDQVRSQFASETNLVQNGAKTADGALARAENDLKCCQQELALATRRVSDLQAEQYSIDDRDGIDKAESNVWRDRAPAILLATTERDQVAGLVQQKGKEEEVLRAVMDETQAIVAVLDQSGIPRVVQSAIDIAVADTTKQHDAFVAAQQSAMDKARRDLEDLKRRIAELNQKAAHATTRSNSLQESLIGGVFARMFYVAWWGSFFTDYEQKAAAATRHRLELERQGPMTQSHLDEAKASLDRANAERLGYIEETRRDVLAKQHEQYREKRDRLPKDIEEIQFAIRELQSSLQAKQVLLDTRTEECRKAVETAHAAVASALFAAAQRSLAAGRVALQTAEAKASQARKNLEEAQAKVMAVAARVSEVTDNRTREINGALESKGFELEALRKSFDTSRSTLRGVLPIPITFDAESIQNATRQLTDEHDKAQNRLKFLDAWTQFLDRESDQLRGRLAQYVNLVCATTVGIATDEYFGDKGAFVEKQFDLLVIDEAGKVTEPEFLVAAVRAKRWVLVGDHKQLPPYYDQILDPYLRSANQVRLADHQSPLDPQALRLSIFERLWYRYNPGRLAVSAELSTTSAPRATPDEPDGPPDQEEIGGSACDAAGASRCVTLDVQRRMHPDLAVFISEMFYNGRYFSPQDECFALSKTLELAHFPKPVTFIDVCPGKGSPGYEVDLSNREQRRQHLGEHDAKLPDRGYANPLEAKQIIHVLESIADDAVVHREQAQLQHEGEQIPLVGIIALYAGQVALIHRLIELSPSLGGERLSESEWLCRGLRVAVNSVDAFQGKECPIIILSFTRSNRRRAVGFVDDPNRLNVALSRARKKLILIGDSETLSWRSRNGIDGARDTRAGKEERHIFSQLVRYVEGRGRTMRIFQRRGANP